MEPELRFKMYAQVTAPLGLFSAIVCAIAVVANYSYPQQRRFPNAILIWNCITDVLYGIYIMSKWTPGPIRDYFSRPDIDPSICTFSIYLQWAMQEATSILSLTLAYTLYATIVKRYNLGEMRKYYYYRYLAGFWLPTLLIPLACLFEPPYEPNTVCRVKTAPVIVFKVINWILPIGVQVVLMAQVIIVIHNVTKDVKNNSSGPPPSNEPLAWICARFLGAQCGQLIVWLPVVLWDFLYMEAFPISYSLVVFSAFAPGFLAFNGFIILGGNKLFWNSLSAYYQDLKSRFIFRFSRKVAPTLTPMPHPLPFPKNLSFLAFAPPSLPFTQLEACQDCSSEA